MMDTQVIRSHSPVTFDMPSAILHANAMTLRSSESTLIFRGKVSLHIDRSEQQKQAQGAAKSTPPQVKAPQEPAREPAAPSVSAQLPPAPIQVLPEPEVPSQPVQMPALPQ
jgi:hypothetical protein